MERYLLFQPDQKLYHCGSFLDPDQQRAYLFHSLQFAKQGLMGSLVDLGDKKSWRIQKAKIETDEFGDVVNVTVLEETSL